MAIGAFEVCTPIFMFRIDIPATASFVCYEGSSIGGGYLLDERSIFEDGLEPIVD
jgi:hypothetical protein